MTTRRLFAPGPFRADQLRSGDEYELSDGHAIHVAPAGGRHGAATVAATFIIQSDPLVEHAGVDVGYSPEPGTLRAPDVSVMPSAPAPGWAPGVPPLAIEYADRHQDEDDLRIKIQDLLGRGTKLMWVVRLEGIRRVEVHSPAGMRVHWGGELLEAPGILQNPVPVDALFDPHQAMELALDNLLARAGYRSLDDVRQEGREEGRQEGREEGREEGQRQALVDLVQAQLAARAQPVDDALQARIDAATLDELRAWILQGSPARG